MELLKIQEAISMLSSALHEEQAMLPRLRYELTKRLADLALQGLSCEDESLDEIRAAIEHAERSIREIPPVIELLEMQETTQQEQEKADSRLAGKMENDRKFFELLNQIVTAGTATPADIVMLNQYAGSSTNPARKYDCQRLEECLDDHDRRLHAAKARNYDPPVFAFALEENGGK